MSELITEPQRFPKDYVEYVRQSIDWIWVKPIDQEVFGFDRFKWFLIVHDDEYIIVRHVDKHLFGVI